MKVGDKNKLKVIKARAEQGRITYQLDQKYVEKLMIYYNYNEPTPPQKPYQAPPPQKPYQAPPPQKPYQAPPSNTSNSCSSCGAQIIDNNQFCTECGAQNTSVQPTPPQYQQQPPPQYQQQPPPQYPGQGGKPSAAWWLLPIFLQFIGGIISWIAIHDRDPRMAKNTLILGIVLTVLPGAVFMVIALGMASIPYDFDMMR
jgi:hypothetical protein